MRIETPTQTQIFTYDSQHRRLSQTIDQTTRYFLYDGQNEIGSFDENLTPLALRILGETPHAEIGAAIALELQGKIYASIHDLQGNIAALLPINRSEPTFYHYSAFGEEKHTGPAKNPWRFSSKRTDEGTGLVYYGRRFYMPELGRWLTPDPRGFTDGMNLYAFVHNDPLTHFDEYGLIMTSYKPVEQVYGRSSPANPFLSALGRNGLSKLTHEVYDYCYAPLAGGFSLA
ncbi:MAG: RHS repeat-associated core domain-containing protein, partial [Verrucomicrobiota bacterium]|nr:RHS repeat-associated core domain-containing protein [Verrucomicrobiota bacterium]